MQAIRISVILKLLRSQLLVACYYALPIEQGKNVVFIENLIVTTTELYLNEQNFQ